MPTRILRDWTDSESVNTLSDGAEKFFTRLIMKADDFGRFHGTAKMLRPTLYPLQLDRIREADLDRLIAECVKASLVRRYEAEGKVVLEIVKFGQRSRATASKFPACPSSDGQVTVTCQASARLDGDVAGDVDGDEGEAGKSAQAPPLKSKPDSKDAVVAYAVELGLPASDGESVWDKWQGNGFTNGGKPMKDWRAVLRSWRGYGYLPSQKQSKGQPNSRTKGTFNEGKASQYANGYS